MKLPAFWNANPVAWFAQAEAQFSLRNIHAEETRYWYVISALDSSTSIRVTPLLPTLPSRHSYTELKSLLLTTFGQSDDQRARLFLGIIEIGDRQPSEVMDEMIRLHGPEEPNFILRFAFKRLLPQPVRHALSAYPSIDLRAWAREAYRLMSDHDDRALSIAAVSASPPRQQRRHTPLADLDESEDTPQVAATNYQPCFRRRLTTAPMLQAAREERPADGLCYYHRRFAAAAFNCRQPCTWQGKAWAGSRQ